MTTTTAMDEMYRMFRNLGMSEKHASEAARVIPHRDEVVVKADRKAERETEREAARAVREAERAADREAFAEKEEITVLRNEVKNTKSAIERIDKRLDLMDKRFERVDERFKRMDERFNGVDKSIARLDERMNALESQNGKFFYIFFSLHIITITGLFGLLTKGILWGVAP